MSTPQHVLVAKGTVRLAGKTNHFITVAGQDFPDEGSQTIILAKYSPKMHEIDKRMDRGRPYYPPMDLLTFYVDGFKGALGGFHFVFHCIGCSGQN